VISQVELAKSHWRQPDPLREALRMLQEEGLIEAEPNRRARVTRFDPGDLDTVYGCRVMLESLGCVLTVRSMTDEEVHGLQTALDSMVDHAKTHNVDEWQTAHREFHRILVGRANDQFGRTIAAYQDRAERYWVMFIRANGATGLNMRDAEHRALFESAAKRDPPGHGNPPRQAPLADCADADGPARSRARAADRAHGAPLRQRPLVRPGLTAPRSRLGHPRPGVHLLDPEAQSVYIHAVAVCRKDAGCLRARLLRTT
jgi:DNA-binding GntR family transcriptional regulator